MGNYIRNGVMMRKRHLSLKKRNLLAVIILGLCIVCFYFLADPPFASGNADFTHRHSPPHNFTEAKKLAKQLFAEHRFTFYCDCPFDKQGKVDIKACGYQIQKDKRRAKRLEWEHLVPVSLIANHLPCWRGQGCREQSQGKGKGECLKGRRCC